MARIEKAQGTDYIVLMEYMDASTKKVELLLGQTSHSLNITNNLTEVESFKDMEVSEGGSVSYTERSDGKRDFTLSVSVGRAKNADDQKIQKELFTRITSKQDTTTVLYVGEITAGDAGAVMFAGQKVSAKIASFNQDFPDGADITGTIEFQGSGVAIEDVPLKDVTTLVTA